MKQNGFQARIETTADSLTCTVLERVRVRTDSSILTVRIFDVNVSSIRRGGVQDRKEFHSSTVRDQKNTHVFLVQGSSRIQ